MDSAGTRRHAVRERLRSLTPGPTWRRRLIIIALVVGTQAAVLCVTYRAVVFHNRTLLTGSVVSGTEGGAPPYGYPGTVPGTFNEVDAGASAWQLVPQFRKAHDELAAGLLPLWSANVMLGAPLAADPQGLLNPLTWPILASPTPAVWDAWLLARLLLAGVLCSALAWYLGLRPGPATIAGLVYMMSGVFQLRTTTIQTTVMAVLPLLILAAERCLRNPSRRSSALLAAAVAVTILSGMPEESFICLAMGALYFVVRLAGESLHNRRMPNARVVYAGAGGGLVGLLFSLPLILPFLEFLGLGWTSHPPGAHNALAIEDARQLLRLVGPHWTGAGPYYQAGFAPFDNWFGIGAIFLAVLGAFTRAFPRGVRTLMLLTAVLVEAKAVGFPGWFNEIVGNLPVISQIALWAYSGVLVSLAVALLGGAGLQRIELGAVKARWAVAAGVLLAAIVAAAAPAFVAGKAAVSAGVTLTAVTLIVVVVGTCIVGRSRGRLGVVGMLLVAGAVTAELILLATPGVPLPVRYDSLSPTPTSQYLQRFMPSGSGRSYSSTQILYPSTNQAFGLDDVRNLDAIYLERTFRYLKLFVDPSLTDRFDGLGANSADFIHNPFMNALNVEYILVAPGQSNTTSLPLDQFTLETIAADGVSIYRNREAAPRAQVFFNVAAATSEQDAASKMSQPGFDPTTSAVVETNRSQPVNSSPPVSAHIDSYADNKVVITTATSQPGTLVVADAYYPGWQTEVDGKPASMFPVDIALRGVRITAGTHTVTMQYRPQSVEAGALGIPAGLLVFGAGGWVIPWALRVRRGSRASPVAANR
jgi:Bacterial membrane protein YfhO